jgi:hypothetical protein
MHNVQNGLIHFTVWCRFGHCFNHFRVLGYSQESQRPGVRFGQSKNQNSKVAKVSKSAKYPRTKWTLDQRTTTAGEISSEKVPIKVNFKRIF